MQIKNSRQSILRGLVVMSILAALVAAAFGGLNWLSASLQGVAARQFASIDEARRSLGFAQVSVPAYFPEGISWPPVSLIGQKKPFPALAMEFRAARRSDIALIIVQQSGNTNPRALQRVALSSIQEETAYTIKNRPALLQVGRCTSGSPCSQMRWTRNDVHHTVLFLGPPIELIRLAESMIH